MWFSFHLFPGLRRRDGELRSQEAADQKQIIDARCCAPQHMTLIIEALIDPRALLWSAFPLRWRNESNVEARYGRAEDD